MNFIRKLLQRFSRVRNIDLKKNTPKYLTFCFILLSWFLNIQYTSAQAIQSNYFKKKHFDNNNTFLYKMLFGKDRKHGWACGDFGLIEYTLDGGFSWKHSESIPVEGYLTCIYFLSDNRTGWAAGTNGIILKSIDGGQTWVNTYHDLPNLTIQDIYFSDDQKYGVLITTDKIFETFDAGVHWKEKSFNLEDTYLKIRFASQNDGYILCVFGLLKTEDSGKNWVDITADPAVSNLQKISDYDFSELYLAFGKKYIGTEFGEVKLSGSNIRNWVNYKLPTDRWINNFSFINQNTGWVCADTNIIYKTIDGGRNWSQNHVFGGGMMSISFINFTDSLNGNVFGQYGKHLYTRDGGKTWLGDSLFRNNIFKIISINKQIYTCSSTYLQKLNANGVEMSIKLGNKDTVLTSFFSNDEHNIWIATNKGVVLHAKDNLTRFTRLTVNKGLPLADVYFDKSNQQGWAISRWGEAYKINGVIVNTFSLPIKDSLNAMAFNEDLSKGFIVCNNGGLLTYDGLRWKKSNSIPAIKNSDFKKIIFDKFFKTGFIIVHPLNLHGQLQGDSLLRTTNGGKNWSKVNLIENQYTFSNIIWIGNVIWLLTNNGNVLQSLDNGENWYVIKPALNYYSLNDAKENTDEIVIVGDHGFINHLKQTNHVPKLLDFDLLDRDILKIPQIKLSNSKIDSIGYVVSIQVINSNERSFTKCFNLRDISNISWDKDDFDINSEYKFRITITDGLSSQSLEKSIFIGQTLWFRIKNIMGWDHWPVSIGEVTQTFGANLTLLIIIYILVIIFLYAYFPIKFIMLHEAISASKLPAPNKTSKFLLLFLIDSDRSLNAFVKHYANIFSDDFNSNEEVRKRSKWVPSPFKLNNSNIITFNKTNRDYEEGLTEIKEKLITERSIILIQGQGGVGKTTLAVQITDWASNINNHLLLFECKALPIFFNKLSENLDDACKNKILLLTGFKDISDDLLNGLLRKKRIIACIDGISEMINFKNDFIDPEKGAKNTFAFVFTSRKPNEIRNIINIIPFGISVDFMDYILNGFIETYAGANKFGNQREIIRTRVLEFINLAQQGDQQIPALILKLIIIKAVSIVDRNGSLSEDLPSSVFSLFTEYIDGLFHIDTQNNNDNGKNQLKIDLRKIAVVSLGLNSFLYHFKTLDLLTKEILPKWVSSKNLEIFSFENTLEPFIDCGLLLITGDTGDKSYKFMYDSLAEYLCAEEIIILYKATLLNKEQLSALKLIKSNSFKSKLREVAIDKNIIDFLD